MKRPEIGTILELNHHQYMVCSYEQACAINPNGKYRLPLHDPEVFYIYWVGGADEWVGFEFVGNLSEYRVVGPTVDIDGAW